MKLDDKLSFIKKFRNVDIKTLAILSLLVLLFILAITSRPKKVKVLPETERELINKTFTVETDKNLSDKIALEEQIEAVSEYSKASKNRIEELEKQNVQLQTALEGLKNVILNQAEGSVNTTSLGTNYPDAPVYSNYNSDSHYNNSYPETEKHVVTESFGGIRRISWKKAEDATDNKSRKQNYLPSTTILKGTLLNGLYAPTLTKGRSAPLPVIIRVEDLTLLPNEVQRNIEGCRLMGEAYGELSDSRVHIRLTKMACMTYDGKAYVDDAVKGVVFGEDGTIGVNGKILGNFNSILLNSFFMESLAGLGEAVKMGAKTTVISDTGSSRDIIDDEGGWNKTQKVMVSGVGDGLGNGFKMISEFYLSMLKEMVPVIQINGGRSIEVLFTEGIELKLQENVWSYGELL